MSDDVFHYPDGHTEALYGVSDEVIQEILFCLDQDNIQGLYDIVRPMHAADVADILYNLKPDQRYAFVQAIRPIFDPEVLSEVEDTVRKNVLEALGLDTLARFVSSLDSDDAVRIIEDLDDDAKEDLLRALPKSERAIFEKYLSYPERSAGRLMQREIVCIPPFWSIQEAIEFIREGKGLPDVFYELFVVDPRHHPLGKISLNELLRHAPETDIETIMNQEIHPIPVRTDQGDVARSFDHYGLISAPVVNEGGRILGVITVDDVVDVIEEEAEADILHMAKVSPTTDFYAPVMRTAYWRIRWLAVTIVNTLLATHVISLFEESIHKITALAFLMTINAAMGGNAGMQVVTVVVRALATRDLRDADTWKAVRKEVAVALVVGLFCATTLGAYASFWQGDLRLGAVLFAALMANMLWAAFAGTLLPIIVDRLNMDPAVSAGPILTTTTDVLGYAIFLGLASLILL
jgi:magnesium transporter